MSEKKESTRPMTDEDRAGLRAKALAQRRSYNSDDLAQAFADAINRGVAAEGERDGAHVDKRDEGKPSGEPSGSG